MLQEFVKLMSKENSIPPIDLCLDCQHLRIDHIPPSLVFPSNDQNLGYCVGTKGCMCNTFNKMEYYLEN